VLGEPQVVQLQQHSCKCVTSSSKRISRHRSGSGSGSSSNTDGTDDTGVLPWSGCSVAWLLRWEVPLLLLLLLVRLAAAVQPTCERNKGLQAQLAPCCTAATCIRTVAAATAAECA
jgi:hypothetical protein